MKRDHIIKGLSVMAMVLTLNACKKDSASSITSGTEMSFAVGAANPTTQLTASINNSGLAVNTVGAAGKASIAWTAGTANISAFKLETKRNNKEVEITSKGLTNIDLFAITPAAISTVIDTGTYREIELRVLLVKSSTTTIPLTLKGNFTTQGGAIVPIEFDFNDDAVIKIEAENVTIDGKTDLSALAKIDLTKMLSGTAAATLDAATRTNGTLLISSTVNAAIYDKIKANVILSGGWGGFKNHDKSERVK